MTKHLSCIVIDDDPLDRLAVETEILNYVGFKLIGSFDNCMEALSFYDVHMPDVLFVDIDMPEVNGLDFIRSINQFNSVNVIISSHPEYALQGFQLKVFDFILKPLESGRFDSTIRRLKDFLQLKEKAQAYDVLFENEKVIFKDGHNLVNINANEILYLEAYGDYTKIVTEKKSHLTLTTLSNFMESLPTGKFMRIHRSYVIALNKVNSFNVKTIGIGIDILPVGKTYLREAKHAFKVKPYA
ncbi:LytTR family DNA-binding domain-containing protein [Mucilaginibacter sp.]|uniref:LytR/AlgR family response regulator transcription factor n=1 Tax=Mucilaginibacter sp. TaxID=1882438 RepID=UPI003267EE2F